MYQIETRAELFQLASKKAATRSAQEQGGVVLAKPKKPYPGKEKETPK